MWQQHHAKLDPLMLLAMTATIHRISKVFIVAYLNVTQFLHISFYREFCVLFIDVFDSLFSHLGIKVYSFDVSTDNVIFVYIILQ